MRLLRLAAEVFYVTICSLIALPAFLYAAWGAKFLHGSIPLTMMLASIAWVVGGMVLLSAWRRSRGKTMRDVIASVEPAFHAQVELADYLNCDATGITRYVGIDTVTGKAVVVDMEKRMAKCVPISYIQSAEVGEAKDNIHSTFTFHFRDFANPSMEIRINRLRANGTGAQLRYALEHAAS